MQSALRITTTVLSGGKIELQLPLESVGDEVEVFVVLPENHNRRNAPFWSSLQTFIGKGHSEHPKKLIGISRWRKMHGTTKHP